MKTGQNKIFYAIVSTVLKIILIIYNRCTSKWLFKLPKDEKFIVACNHASNLDPVIVGCFFPRRLRYFAKHWEQFQCRDRITLLPPAHSKAS